MSVRLGINGFGRIGRLVFRAAMEDDRIEVVGINDITDAATLAHLLKYDSVHGRFNGEVSHTDSAVVVNGKDIPVSSVHDPAELPWGELEVDVALESTGRFRDRENASKHLKAGAKRVIISAPGKDPDITIVLGVNHQSFDPQKHFIISNASCTTNCLAPVAKVLDENFKIVSGFMTTVHAYTNDQRILDLPHSDLRRARAAAVSMIPTTTGAAVAVGLVLPQLKGKLDGMAVRVPTPNVSLVDLVVQVEKSATAEEVNSLLKAAAEGEMKGILGYSEEPLVSIDYNGCPLSSVVDALSTKVLGNQIKVISWYDNESGYSHRVKDLAVMVGEA